MVKPTINGCIEDSQFADVGAVKRNLIIAARTLIAAQRYGPACIGTDMSGGFMVHKGNSGFAFKSNPHCFQAVCAVAPDKLLKFRSLPTPFNWKHFPGLKFDG